MSFPGDQSVDTTRRSNRSPTPQQREVEHAPTVIELMSPLKYTRSPKRHRSPRQARSRSSGHLHSSGKLVPTRSLSNMEDQITRKLKMEDAIAKISTRNTEHKGKNAPQPPLSPFSPPPNTLRRGGSSKLEKANRAQEELRKKYAMHMEKRAKSTSELFGASFAVSESDLHPNQETSLSVVELPLNASRSSTERVGISLSRLEEDAKQKQSARLVYDPEKRVDEEEKPQQKPSERGEIYRSTGSLEEDAKQKRSARQMHDPHKRTDEASIQRKPSAAATAQRSIKSFLLSNTLGGLYETEAQIRQKSNGTSSQLNVTMERLSSSLQSQPLPDQARQQLESMEHDLLVKGNLTTGTRTLVLESQTGRQMINDSCRPHAAAALSHYQDSEQNSAYFRRITKALDVAVPAGSLGPGAYRAGIYDSSSEEESMTNSDRLLYQTESERHRANLTEVGLEHQVQQQQHLECFDQERSQPEHRPSLQPSFSQQLGLGDVACFEYEQEASVQRIKVNGRRICDVKWIVLGVTVIVGFAIGLSVGLTGKRKQNSIGALTVGKCNFDSKVMMDQCTSDGRVSNIPSCVLERYGDVVRKLKVPTMEPIDSCSSSNLAILSMAAAGHDAVHRSMYALSSFFFSTKGPSAWKRTDGWGILSDVCLWYGITCLEVCNTQVNGMQECKQDPEQISNITLSGNGLEGVLPTELSLLSSLKRLELSYNRVEGSIVTEICRLPLLNVLDLNFNPTFSGPIPSEIGGLTNLRELLFSTTKLTGTIPTTIGLLKSLEVLELMLNGIRGTLPTELGALTTLQSLSLSSNFVSGQLPTELGECRNLTTLDVQRNGLSGFVPSEFGQLTRMRTLYLNENSIANSEFPIEICWNLSNLAILGLSDNDISGSLPSEIGLLTSLVSLYLGRNQFVGEVPTELGLCQKLLDLTMEQNDFSGTIPTQLGSLKVLQTLYISGNHFTGNLPSELGLLTKLTGLFFESNNLSGYIPEEVCSLWDYSLIELSGASLSGTRDYGGAMCPSSACC